MTEQKNKNKTPHCRIIHERKIDFQLAIAKSEVSNSYTIKSFINQEANKEMLNPPYSHYIGILS